MSPEVSAPDRDPGSHLACPACGTVRPIDSREVACVCGDLLEVAHAFPSGLRPEDLDRPDGPVVPWGRSGVWRFHRLVAPHLPIECLVSLGEGDTPLLASPGLARFAGASELLVKHEGMNPTGSFKDRGMTVAVSHAVRQGARWLVCASTGNTAASLAAYAARAGARALVLVPEGGTALGKLSQAMAYGARTVLLRGDFDAAMRITRQLHADPRFALLNSANPLRLEGQKTIPFEILRELEWRPPDWIVFPAGNLGNCAAFGKALRELSRLGWIHSLPRLAAVQAAGAAPFAAAFRRGFDGLQPVRAETRASAIRIGHPVSYRRAVRSIDATRGIVLSVSDDEIFAAKARVDADGLGAEPASCAAVAGVRKLVRSGHVAPGQRVVCVLTGHLLKDPEATMGYHAGELSGIHSSRANPPVVVDARPEDVLEVLDESDTDPEAS